MKKLMIAGSGSYIGSELARFLGNFPGEYSLGSFSLRQGMPSEEELKGADVLFCASGLVHKKETGRNREEFFDVNCRQVLELAAKAKKAGTGQFIYMSSISVYGLLSGEIDENTGEKPRSAYAASKLQAEQGLRALEGPDFAVSIIRAPMVYGPNCPGNYRRLRKLALRLPFFPRIENRRSMIYIGNLCAFIKKLADGRLRGCFVPQNGEYVCTSELTEAIARENGRKIRLIPFPASLPGLIRLPVFEKLFGSLICKNGVRLDEFSIARSVELSEKGWGRLPPAGKREPLVSVIIPSYNSAKYLPAAIDSALIQEADEEIIVVDDGSQDNTAAVMAPYLSDSRIKYIKNEKNMGAAASRRRGIASASGAYIAFLDADDIWCPGKLSRQLRLMEEGGYVICAAARELMDSSGRPLGIVHPVRESFGYRELLRENFISCSSVIIRAEAAREFPMLREDVHEDYVCWLSVLKRYGRGCGINEPLIKYRVSSTGKSGSKLHSSRLTYKSYRLHGFGPLGAAWRLFIFSANTLSRYLRAYLNKK